MQQEYPLAETSCHSCLYFLQEISFFIYVGLNDYLLIEHVNTWPLFPSYAVFGASTILSWYPQLVFSFLPNFLQLLPIIHLNQEPVLILLSRPHILAALSRFHFFHQSLLFHMSSVVLLLHFKPPLFSF